MMVVTPPAAARLARRSKRLAMAGAGLADEGAHVDEAGRDQLAAAVDHVGAFRHAGGADALLGFADHAIGDQQIAGYVEIARRIDDAGIGEQNRAAVGEHYVPTLSFPDAAQRRSGIQKQMPGTHLDSGFAGHGASKTRATALTARAPE